MGKHKKQKQVKENKKNLPQKEAITAKYVEFSDDFVEKVKNNRRTLLRKKVCDKLVETFGKSAKVHTGANYRKLVELIKNKS